MNDPTLSHLTSQLRTRPSIQLSQTGSGTAQPKPTVIHVTQDMATDADEVCLGFLWAAWFFSLADGSA